MHVQTQHLGASSATNIDFSECDIVCTTVSVSFVFKSEAGSSEAIFNFLDPAELKSKNGVQDMANVNATNNSKKRKADEEDAESASAQPPRKQSDSPSEKHSDKDITLELSGHDALAIGKISPIKQQYAIKYLARGLMKQKDLNPNVMISLGDEFPLRILFTFGSSRLSIFIASKLDE